MKMELLQFIIGMYCVIKFFQYLDTQPKDDYPQDYM